MRHEIAILASASLGPYASGAVLTIDQVKAICANTGAARGVRFVCADCGVPVHAVIPRPYVRTRKTTPSAYFSSSPAAHRVGCTRLPVSVPQLGNATDQRAPRPRLGPVPVVWRDPRLESSVIRAKPPPNPAALGASPRGQRVSGKSKGTVSEPTSELVSSFAEAWQVLSAPERAASPLIAEWNLGGTYDTAFFDLSAPPPTWHPRSPMLIYVGAVAAVKAIATGFQITLQSRHASGREMRIWLQARALNRSAVGASLIAALHAGSIQPDMTIFALGEFAHTPSKTGNYEWYAMPMTFAQLFHAK